MTDINEGQPAIQPPSKKKSGCLIAIVIVVLLMGLFGINSAKENEPKEPKDTRVHNPLLIKEMELSKDQESDIVDLFTACGIGEITKAERFQGNETETSYWVKDEETSYYNEPIVVFLFNDTRQVKAIYYDDNDIYLAGGAINDIRKYYVNSDQRFVCQYTAEELIPQCLTVPLSAKFKAPWNYKIENGHVMVQSRVNYKNTFGVDFESEFQITFDESANPISVILGGKEFLK